jgi:hypothetical protein
MPDRQGITADSAATEEPAATPIHSMGKLEVPQTYMIDLDRGTVTIAGADIWFDAVTPSQLFLVPRNGAQMAPGDLSKRDFEACSAETYSTDRISLHHLPPGSFICVKTSGGRIASVKVDILSSGGTSVLALNYVVWE